MAFLGHLDGEVKDGSPVGFCTRKYSCSTVKGCENCPEEMDLCSPSQPSISGFVEPKLPSVKKSWIGGIGEVLEGVKPNIAHLHEARLGESH